MISNLSRGLSSPQRWDVIVGRLEPDLEGRLCCLGVDTPGDYASLAGVSRVVNQQLSAAQGLFHRNRITNAIGITVLTL